MRAGRSVIGTVAAVVVLLAALVLIAVGAGHLRWRARTAELLADLARSAPEAVAPGVATAQSAATGAATPTIAAALPAAGGSAHREQGPDAGRPAARPLRHDRRELDGLPPPVRRYFEAVLPDGAPIVTAATLAHEGTFRQGDGWRPFTSTQRVAALRPGFVWDARIRMLPGVPVHVHDAYVSGTGVLQAAVVGLVPVADLRGTGELAHGELLRWFAEAPWYPTALLPGQGVRWEAIDDRTARATRTDGPITVTLRFSFGDDGLITAVRADARGRTVGRSTVQRPWEGRYWDYALRDGLHVPLRGEVAWLLPPEEGGRQPYWRGTLTEIALQRAP